MRNSETPIDDQADATLLPKLHLLDLVCGNVSKPRLLKKARELLVFRFIDCKLYKIHTCWLSNLWQIRLLVITLDDGSISWAM